MTASRRRDPAALLGLERASLALALLRSLSLGREQLSLVLLGLKSLYEMVRIRNAAYVPGSRHTCMRANSICINWSCTCWSWF